MWIGRAGDEKTTSIFTLMSPLYIPVLAGSLVVRTNPAGLEVACM
jgi:hypothetical protein